jgi:hypothetical protein
MKGRSFCEHFVECSEFDSEQVVLSLSLGSAALACCTSTAVNIPFIDVVMVNNIIIEII